MTTPNENRPIQEWHNQLAEELWLAQQSEESKLTQAEISQLIANSEPSAPRPEPKEDEVSLAIEFLRGESNRLLIAWDISPTLKSAIHFVCTELERLQGELAAREETPRDGNWVDKWGSCKVCGGEIPYGHTENCDIYKLECREREIKPLLDCIEELLKGYRTTMPEGEAVQARARSLLASHRRDKEGGEG